MINHNRTWKRIYRCITESLCSTAEINKHCKLTLKVKVAQSCPTLCDPTDYTAHGILQARILEWVAFPFSRGSSQSRVNSLLAGRLFTSWATREAPLYINTTFYDHSFVSKHLGCFHILPVRNNATVNMAMQVCLWEPHFNSFGSRPRSEISGSNGTSFIFRGWMESLTRWIWVWANSGR